MSYEGSIAALVRGIEVGGIVVLVVGGVAALLAFTGRVARRRAFGPSYDALRADLGRAILLGLEFLVAADIIGTIAVEPTFRSLGVLALIVVIRTFLSIALEVEIEGRWPWQRSGEARGEREPGAPPARPDGGRA
jgi:uncharacterized membrane protein